MIYLVTYMYFNYFYTNLYDFSINTSLCLVFLVEYKDHLLNIMNFIFSGENVEEAFLDTARKIYQNIQDGRYVTYMYNFVLLRKVGCKFVTNAISLNHYVLICSDLFVHLIHVHAIH